MMDSKRTIRPKVTTTENRPANRLELQCAENRAIRLRDRTVPRRRELPWGRLIFAFMITLTLCTGELFATDNNNNDSAMKTQKHYTTSFTVEQTPQEVFDAIKNVRGWWSGEIEGNADKLGAEFTYRVPNIHYSKQKVTEFVPGEKVVWRVLDADLTFVKDKSEWKGTDIIFEIAKKGQKTEVRFTHRGLVPTYECYDKCSDSWGALVNGNLRRLIATGQVQPSPW